MNLDQLLTRSKDIDASIVNMTAQLNALHGHKAEVTHWISQLESSCKKVNETQIESCVEPVVE